MISAANLVFTALGMSIVDRVGRRPLVAYVSCPGVILGCSWCIVALYYLTKPTGFQLIDDGTVSYDSGKQIAVIMGFVFYVGEWCRRKRLLNDTHKLCTVWGWDMYLGPCQTFSRLKFAV